MDPNNLNLDENKINQIKNMVDNGNLSDAVSQISPEMIQNFSKMFNQANAQSSNSTTNASTNDNTTSNPVNNSSSNSSGFDFSQLDMNTIMKMTSAFGGSSQKNDPRSNLLNSLKPYMRDSKKEKLDTYASLLNMSKIAEVFKNNNNNSTTPNPSGKENH